MDASKTGAWRSPEPRSELQPKRRSWVRVSLASREPGASAPAALADIRARKRSFNWSLHTPSSLSGRRPKSFIDRGKPRTRLSPFWRRPAYCARRRSRAATGRGRRASSMYLRMVVPVRTRRLRSGPPGCAETNIKAKPQDLRCSSQCGQRDASVAGIEHAIDDSPARPHLLGEPALGDASALHCLAELQRERLLVGEELGFLADVHLVEERAQAGANMLLAHRATTSLRRVRASPRSWSAPPS